jgi:hypothetical protein
MTSSGLRRCPREDEHEYDVAAHAVGYLPTFLQFELFAVPLVITQLSPPGFRKTDDGEASTSYAALTTDERHSR